MLLTLRTLLLSLGLAPGPSSPGTQHALLCHRAAGPVCCMLPGALHPALHTPSLSPCGADPVQHINASDTELIEGLDAQARLRLGGMQEETNETED